MNNSNDMNFAVEVKMKTKWSQNEVKMKSKWSQNEVKIDHLWPPLEQQKCPKLRTQNAQKVLVPYDLRPWTKLKSIWKRWPTLLMGRRYPMFTEGWFARRFKRHATSLRRQYLFTYLQTFLVYTLFFIWSSYHQLKVDKGKTIYFRWVFFQQCGE